MRLAFPTTAEKELLRHWSKGQRKISSLGLIKEQMSFAYQSTNLYLSKAQTASKASFNLIFLPSA